MTQLASPLAGRTALVTGGGRGIGAATALLLAERGAAVAVNYRRDADAAASVVDAIIGAGGKAVAVAGDVTDQDDVRRVVDETSSALGAPDLLVLSAAGISSLTLGPLTAVDPVTLANGVAEQVRAVLLPVHAALPGMDERGGGSVVVVSATIAGNASANLPLVATAKAAAETVVRCLALELGPRGVRVNAVAPGFVQTDASAAHVPPEARARMAAETPLRRTALPADIAAAVLALVTGPDYVTGATLPVDGGAAL